jgi:ATP-dependent Clp protease ATP-binding subunit ClpA
MHEFYDRFAAESKEIMGVAYAEAEEWKHDYVGTEHLLLALLKVRGTVVCRFLEDQEIVYAKVSTEIERVVGKGKRRFPTDDLMPTPQLKRIVILAHNAAQQYGHQLIGPEHLLLGLMEEGNSEVVRVLNHFGVDRSKLGQLLQSAPKAGRGRRLHRWDSGEEQLTSHDDRERLFLYKIYILLAEESKEIMSISYAEAEELNHDFVGAEHLLLALLTLLKVRGTSVYRLMRELNITYVIARAETERLLDKGEKNVPIEELEINSQFKEVLILAHNTSKQYGHHRIHLEHLLAGLCEESDSKASHILSKLGVDKPKIEALLESTRRKLPPGRWGLP